MFSSCADSLPGLPVYDNNKELQAFMPEVLYHMTDIMIVRHAACAELLASILTGCLGWRYNYVGTVIENNIAFVLLYCTT